MHQESSTGSNGGLKRPVPGEKHCLGQYSTIFLVMHSSISRNTMERLTNHNNFISLGGVETSTEHPNIPWAYEHSFSSSLMFIIYTCSWFIASNKQIFLRSLVKMVLRVPSLHLLYICLKMNIFWFYWFLCSLWLSGTIELQYTGIAREGQRTLVQNLPLFCSV